MAYRFYAWSRKYAKILSLQPLTECRLLSHTLTCRPCSQAPGIYRVQEEAPVCNPTLVRLPPGPQSFPFEAVMLGITENTLCHHPPPHPSLGSASLLLMWKSTSCHHHLCDSPPYYHYPIRVTAIMMTLTCGVMHMITEQYSCCFV